MTRVLNNGLSFPSIGMGTYPLKGRAMTDAVVSATRYGYRAFDTAKAYGNEDSLGDALRVAYKINGLSRSDVIITSKIGEDLDHGMPNCKTFYPSYPGEKKDICKIVADQLDGILRNLQTDYLDVLLIHWPFPHYLPEIWNAMENEYRDGRVRAIGVSNFRERHLERIAESGSIVPMMNQFEMNPLNSRRDLVAYCQARGIQVQSYSPLGVMNRSLMGSEVLASLSKKHGKTIPQIVLRWHVERGAIPIPKSGNPQRLSENISVFDFTLDDADMRLIDGLNEDYTSLVESRYCPGY